VTYTRHITVQTVTAKSQFTFLIKYKILGDLYLLGWYAMHFCK